MNTGAENDSTSRELAREILAVGRTYSASTGLHPVMELRLDRFLRGGDHRSFSEAGFPAVRFTEWRENFNHQHQRVRIENGIQYGDLLEFDDFNYIAKVARLNMATLATLADSPGVPQHVRVSTRNLDNDTILEWDPPESYAQAGEVPDCVAGNGGERLGIQRGCGEVSRDGPNSARLPVSKDDVFFGVRACTAAGICSQAVAPVPSRN